MLYELFSYLKNTDLPGKDLGNFLSFRAGAAIILSLLITIFFGKYVIRMLRRKQIGEDIRDLGLEGQLQKKGTPTMGGIIIIMAVLIPVLLFSDLSNVYIQLMLITTVWLGFIGGLDDYIKVFRHKKEGLNGRFKVFGQVGLGIIVGTTMWLSSDIVIQEKEWTTTPYEVVDENGKTKTVKEKVVVEKVVETVVESPQVPDDVASRTKPCYTLQEIQTMVNAGMDVHGLTICAVEDINFTSGQSTITEDSIVYLKQVANILIETGLFVEVRGHTDNVGRDADNLELSKERAKAVADYLVHRGVPKDRITYKYFGESRPLVSNDTPEGRKINRRVEFHLINRSE